MSPNASSKPLEQCATACCIHLAPLPLAIRPQRSDALLHLFHSRRVKKVLHCESLLPSCIYRYTQPLQRRRRRESEIDTFS